MKTLAKQAWSLLLAWALAAPAAAAIAVHIHKEAKQWEPVSVRAGGGASTFFKRKLHKSKGKLKGEASRAVARARVYPVKDDRVLVVAVYPKSLRPLRQHLEARFLVIEGYLEKVEVFAVTLKGERTLPLEHEEDSFTLRERGVDFGEESPASAQVTISAFSLTKGSNAGAVRLAAFGGDELGFVEFGWSVPKLGGSPVRR